MNTLEILNSIDSNYGLTNLAKKGIIPASLFGYRDIYLEYDLHIKQGCSITDAVHNTSEKFRISYRTVDRVRKIMMS